MDSYDRFFNIHAPGTLRRMYPRRGMFYSKSGSKQGHVDPGEISEHDTWARAGSNCVKCAHCLLCSGEGEELRCANHHVISCC